MKDSWYRFIALEDKRKVMCISHYAGRAVKGIAKCSPDDRWDISYGKALAKARCDMKIAELRFKNYEKLCDELDREYEKLDVKKRKRAKYFDRCLNEYKTAQKELAKFN